MIALRKTAAAFGAELVTLSAPSVVSGGDVLVDVCVQASAAAISMLMSGRPATNS